jgi:hypothetical protein
MVFPRIIFLSMMLLCVQLRAQDPDLEADESARLEEIFRTSEQEGETPTSFRQRNSKPRRVSVPKGAFRIGSICMDGEYTDTRSTGACAGHAGVRFWVYRTKEGDTVHVSTARHEAHPHALDAAEMSELVQKRDKKIQQIRQGIQPAPVVVLPDSGGNDFDWPDALGISAGGAAAYFIVRMILRWINQNEGLVKYALRHLLRHRKRPPARPRGKDSGEERLP